MYLHFSILIFALSATLSVAVEVYEGHLQETRPHSASIGAKRQRLEIVNSFGEISDEPREEDTVEGQQSQSGSDAQSLAWIGHDGSVSDAPVGRSMMRARRGSLQRRASLMEETSAFQLEAKPTKEISAALLAKMAKVKEGVKAKIAAQAAKLEREAAAEMEKLLADANATAADIMDTNEDDEDEDKLTPPLNMTRKANHTDQTGDKDANRSNVTLPREEQQKKRFGEEAHEEDEEEKKKKKPEAALSEEERKRSRAEQQEGEQHKPLKERVHRTLKNAADRRNTSQVCLALVRPFFLLSELREVRVQFEEWSKGGLFPCATSDQKESARGSGVPDVNVDLIFARDVSDGSTDTHGNPSTNSQQCVEDALAVEAHRMKTAMDTLSAGRCFGRFQMQDVAGDRELDRIGREQEAETHILRANIVFSSFLHSTNFSQPTDLCPNGYDAFYLMEADVLALRDGWLREIVTEWRQAYTEKSAQVFGGLLRTGLWEFADGWAPLKPLWGHINGNGIYSLTDKMRTWVKCILHKAPSVAYDVLMYQMATFAGTRTEWNKVFTACQCQNSQSGGKCSTICKPDPQASPWPLQECIHLGIDVTEYVSSQTIGNLYHAYTASVDSVPSTMQVGHAPLMPARGREPGLGQQANRNQQLKQSCAEWGKWRGAHLKQMAKPIEHRTWILAAPQRHRTGASLELVTAVGVLGVALQAAVIISDSPLDVGMFSPGPLNWFRPNSAEDTLCKMSFAERQVFNASDHNKNKEEKTTLHSKMMSNSLRLCEDGRARAYIYLGDVQNAQRLRELCPEFEATSECCLATLAEVMPFATRAAQMLSRDLNADHPSEQLIRRWAQYDHVGWARRDVLISEARSCAMEQFFVLASTVTWNALDSFSRHQPDHYTSWYMPPDTADYLLSRAASNEEDIDLAAQKLLNRLAKVTEIVVGDHASGVPANTANIRYLSTVNPALRSAADSMSDVVQLSKKLKKDKHEDRCGTTSSTLQKTVQNSLAQDAVIQSSGSWLTDDIIDHLDDQLLENSGRLKVGDTSTTRAMSMYNVAAGTFQQCMQSGHYVTLPHGVDCLEMGFKHVESYDDCKQAGANVRMSANPDYSPLGDNVTVASDVEMTPSDHTVHIPYGCSFIERGPNGAKVATLYFSDKEEEDDEIKATEFEMVCSVPKMTHTHEMEPDGALGLDFFVANKATLLITASSAMDSSLYAASVNSYKCVPTCGTPVLRVCRQNAAVDTTDIEQEAALLNSATPMCLSEETKLFEHADLSTDIFLRPLQGDADLQWAACALRSVVRYAGTGNVIRSIIIVAKDADAYSAIMDDIGILQHFPGSKAVRSMDDTMNSGAMSEEQVATLDMLRAHRYTDARGVVFLERGAVVATNITLEQLWDWNFMPFGQLRSIQSIPETHAGLVVRGVANDSSNLFQEVAQADTHPMGVRMAPRESFQCILELWPDLVAKVMESATDPVGILLQCMFWRQPLKVHWVDLLTNWNWWLQAAGIKTKELNFNLAATEAPEVAELCNCMSSGAPLARVRTRGELSTPGVDVCWKDLYEDLGLL